MQTTKSVEEMQDSLLLNDKKKQKRVVIHFNTAGLQNKTKKAQLINSDLIE